MIAAVSDRSAPGSRPKATKVTLQTARIGTCERASLREDGHPVTCLDLRRCSDKRLASRHALRHFSPWRAREEFKIASSGNVVDIGDLHDAARLSAPDAGGLSRALCCQEALCSAHARWQGHGHLHWPRVSRQRAGIMHLELADGDLLAASD